MIRKAHVREHSAILELWLRSVKVSHLFLTEEDVIQLYQGLKNGWLTAVTLFVLDINNQIVGFIGVDDNKIEMLFIDDGYQGKGYGKKLINFMKCQYPTLLLDVNEQNPHACLFYQKQGFSIIGRSEVDSQGNPFPLLHMCYA